MSQDLRDAWAAEFVEQDFGPVDLEPDEYLDEFARLYNQEFEPLWPDYEPFDWDQAESIPGILTTADLQRILLVTELYDSFAAYANEIDTAWSFWFVDNDQPGQNREQEDLEAFIRNNDLPVAVADQLRLAIRLNLVDDNFSAGEWKDLIEIVAGAASIAGVFLVTGGLGTFLVVAGALGEGVVIALNVNDGNYTAAAIGTAFLVLDVGSFVKAFPAVVNVGRVIREATIDSFGGIARARNAGLATGSSEALARGIDDLAEQLNLPALNDAADSIRRRGPDVVSSPETNTVYLEHRTRDAIEGAVDDAAIAAGGELADDTIEQTVEQTLRSGRGELDPIRYDAANDYVTRNGESGLVAIEKRGDEIIGNDAFADAVDATCLRSPSQLCDHLDLLSPDASIALSGLPNTSQNTIGQLLTGMRSIPDADQGARAAKIFGDWATANDNNLATALEIANRGDGWATIAGSGTEQQLVRLLDAVSSNSKIGQLSTDAVETLLQRSNWEILLTQAQGVASRGVSVRNIDALLTRFSGADSELLLRHIFFGPSDDVAQRMASNALMSRTDVTDYVLRADDAVAAAGNPPESITYLLLQHQSLATNIATTDGLAQTRQMIDKVRDSMINPRLIPEAGNASAAELRSLEDVAGGHGYGRHGAHTPLWQHFRRAITKERPDGGFDPGLSPASRFLSHDEHLEAIERARQLFNRPGNTEFRFDLVYQDGRVIGEGFTKGASEYVDDHRVVRVVYDRMNRTWLTSFPTTRVPPKPNQKPLPRIFNID